MYRKRRVRSPTPPPLIITFQDEEDDRHSWYWEEHGGGMRLYFGKYKGKKIHDVPLSYLLWCYETFDERPQNVSFLTAFEYYYEGLKSLTEDDYDRFIVPFGKKHRGKTICQCRDKEWMVWTLRQRQLVQKHPIYFDAVRQWLAHPRKQEVHRDIGENLLATEYADDLDLEEDEDEGPDLHGYLRDQPLVEDLDFIDDSSQPASASDHDLDDEDNDTSPSGAAAVSGTASESDRDVGVNDQSTIQDDDDDTQDTGSASDADIVDDADDAARQTPIRNFIVDSTSTDGDESYANSESHSDDVDKVQARVTRSQMKRKAMKKQRNTESSPLTSRSRGRKVIFSVTLSDSSDEDHPRSVLASKKTRNPLAVTSSDIDEPGVTEPPPDPSSSPVSRRRGRMVIMSDTSSNNDPDEPIHGKCPFQNGRYSPLSRRNREIITLDSDSDEEDLTTKLARKSNHTVVGASGINSTHESASISTPLRRRKHRRAIVSESEREETCTIKSAPAGRTSCVSVHNAEAPAPRASLVQKLKNKGKEKEATVGRQGPRKKTYRTDADGEKDVFLQHSDLDSHNTDASISAESQSPRSAKRKALSQDMGSGDDQHLNSRRRRPRIAVSCELRLIK